MSLVKSKCQTTPSYDVRRGRVHQNAGKYPRGGISVTGKNRLLWNNYKLWFLYNNKRPKFSANNKETWTTKNLWIENLIAIKMFISTKGKNYFPLFHFFSKFSIPVIPQYDSEHMFIHEHSILNRQRHRLHEMRHHGSTATSVVSRSRSGSIRGDVTLDCDRTVVFLSVLTNYKIIPFIECWVCHHSTRTRSFLLRTRLPT